MLYLLGIFTGLVIAILIFTILSFFRLGIERKVRIIETRLENAGPRPTGAIFEPEDEAEIVRREHIAKNSRKGKDTPISELL
jgi:hypothetical protein